MARLRGLQDVDFSGRGPVVPLRVGQVVEVEDDGDAALLIERGMAEEGGKESPPDPAVEPAQEAKTTRKKTAKKVAKKK